MQVVVIKSPKCLRGVLRRLFGIKKDKKNTGAGGCSGIFVAHHSFVV